MAKALNRNLSARLVETLKEPGRWRDPEHRGLYLQVQESPRGITKSWLLRFELDGRERWMGLGSTKDFTLKEARERARQARQLLTDGRDPIEVKLAGKDLAAKEARERLTFRAATEQFLSCTLRAGRTPSTASSGAIRSPSTLSPS